MATAIAPFRSFFDQSYKTFSTEKYHLSLQVSDTGLLYVIIDVAENKIIGFEEYRYESNASFSKFENNIKVIFRSGFCKLSFKSVSIYYVSKQCTLIPIDLYDEKEKENLLKLNFKLKADSEIASDKLDVMDAYAVFAFPRFLSSLFDDYFLSYRLRHYATPLIHQFLNFSRIEKKTSVYLNIQTDRFEMLASADEQFIFYNTFDYSNPEDFLYYMLYVLEKLQLNNEHIPVYISGEIEKNTELYRLLATYIKELKFLKRPTNIKYSLKLNELPQHYYFNLFSQYLCE